MRNDTQIYENLIVFLKEILGFYANEDNYVQKHNINNELSSSIELDGGKQAKSALNQIETIEKLTSDKQNELMEKFSHAIKNKQSLDEVLKIIEEFKKYE